jgi:hypothetical protein
MCEGNLGWLILTMIKRRRRISYRRNEMSVSSGQSHVCNKDVKDN